MAWAPDDLWDLTSTFQAVSQGSGGIGKAYYGELFDDTLEVRGIEADAGVSRAIRGVGHEVTSCKSL
jgi:hypothetical protein